MSGVMETKCTTCEHLKVCKFKDSFIELVGKVEKTTIDRLDIHCVEFKCKEYKQKQTTFTR